MWVRHCGGWVEEWVGVRHCGGGREWGLSFCDDSNKILEYIFIEQEQFLFLIM